jgi:hypothetical protein
MNTRQLTSSIARRTSLSVDEVDLVLRCLSDIAKEQVGLLESLDIVDLLKIRCRPKKTCGKGWAVDLRIKKALVESVGKLVIPIGGNEQES